MLWVSLLDSKAWVRIPGQSPKMKYEKNISSATSSQQIPGKTSESKIKLLVTYKINAHNMSGVRS